MKGRKKFRLQNEKRSPGTLFYRFLAIVLIGVLGWLLWDSDFFPAPHQAPETLALQTNAPLMSKPVVPATTNKTNPVRLPQPSGPIGMTSSAPAILPEFDGQGRRPVSNVFEAQLALDRLGFSCGSIDGVLGPQSRATLRVFQRKSRLPQTGDLDNPTKQALLLSEPTIRSYIVTPADVARLRKTGASWTEKARQDKLDYETLLELVSELGHAKPDFIRQLNPGTNLDAASAGSVIKIPEVNPAVTPVKAASIRIRLNDKTLQVFDGASVLLAHFPCSIARLVEKRPIGNLRVISKVSHPNYKFNPDLFPESEESKRGSGPFIIPAGPNNPVGLGWIGLDRSGYGIHGTAKPETIGRTESRGCFRLANWNIERLLPMVWGGMPVIVEP